MTAWGILIEATQRAACRIIISKGYESSEVDYTALTNALKDTIKANIERVQAEWKEATDAHMNEMWLKELMNAQANEMAIAAVKTMGI